MLEHKVCYKWIKKKKIHVNFLNYSLFIVLFLFIFQGYCSISQLLSFLSFLQSYFNQFVSFIFVDLINFLLIISTRVTSVVSPYLSGLSTIIEWSQYHIKVVSVLKRGLITIFEGVNLKRFSTVQQLTTQFVAGFVLSWKRCG